MNFREFIKSLREADLLDSGAKKGAAGKGKDAILNADLTDPETYVKTVRRELLAMKAGVTGKIGQYSIEEIAEWFNPEQPHFEDFFHSIPGALSVTRQREQAARIKDNMTYKLSDPVILNEVFSQLVVNDVYMHPLYDTADYISLLHSKSFKPTKVFREQCAARIAAYIKDFFSDDEIQMFQYTQDRINNGAGIEFRESWLLEAALRSVEFAYKQIWEREEAADMPLIDQLYHDDIISARQRSEVLRGLQVRRRLTQPDNRALAGTLEELVHILRKTLLKKVKVEALHDALGDFEKMSDYLRDRVFGGADILNCYSCLLENAALIDHASPVPGQGKLVFGEQHPFREIALGDVYELSDALQGETKKYFDALPRHKQLYLAAVVQVFKADIIKEYQQKMRTMDEQMLSANKAKIPHLEKQVKHLQERQNAVLAALLQSLTPMKIEHAFEIAARGYAKAGLGPEDDFADDQIARVRSMENFDIEESEANLQLDDFSEIRAALPWSVLHDNMYRLAVALVKPDIAVVQNEINSLYINISMLAPWINGKNAKEISQFITVYYPGLHHITSEICVQRSRQNVEAGRYQDITKDNELIVRAMQENGNQVREALAGDVSSRALFNIFSNVCSGKFVGVTYEREVISNHEEMVENHNAEQPKVDIKEVNDMKSGAVFNNNLSPFAAFLLAADVPERKKQFDLNVRAFLDDPSDQSKVSRFFNEMSAADYSVVGPNIASLAEVRKQVIAALKAAHKEGRLNDDAEVGSVISGTECGAWMDYALVTAMDDLFDGDGNIKHDIARILQGAGLSAETISANWFKQQLLASYVVNIMMHDPRVVGLLEMTDGLDPMENPYLSFNSVFTSFVTAALNRVTSNPDVKMDKKFIDDLHSRMDEYSVSRFKSAVLHEAVVRHMGEIALRQSPEADARELVAQMYRALRNFDIGNDLIVNNAQVLHGSLTYPYNYISKPENAGLLSGVVIGSQQKDCGAASPVRQIDPRFMSELQDQFQSMSTADKLYMGGIVWGVKTNYRQVFSLYNGYLMSEAMAIRTAIRTKKLKPAQNNLLDLREKLQRIEDEIKKCNEFVSGVMRRVDLAFNDKEAKQALADAQSNPQQLAFIDAYTQLELIKANGDDESRLKSEAINTIKRMQAAAPQPDFVDMTDIVAGTLRDLSELQEGHQVSQKAGFLSVPRQQLLSKGKEEMHARVESVMESPFTETDVAAPFLSDDPAEMELHHNLMSFLPYSALKKHIHAVASSLDPGMSNLQSLIYGLMDLYRDVNVLLTANIVKEPDLYGLIQRHYPGLEIELQDVLVANCATLIEAINSLKDVDNADNDLSGQYNSLLIAIKTFNAVLTNDILHEMVKAQDQKIKECKNMLAVVTVDPVSDGYFKHRCEALQQAINQYAGKSSLRQGVQAILDEVIRLHHNNLLAVDTLTTVLAESSALIQGHADSDRIYRYLKFSESLQKNAAGKNLGNIMSEPFKAARLHQACEEYQLYLMDIIHKTLDKTNPGVMLAAVKLKKVKEMQGILERDKPANENLRQFREEFEASRAVIEQRRDSGAMTFLKVVATIFSIGIAWAFGLWRTHGQEAAADMAQTLKTVKQRNSNPK